jgi:hypothetical protein
MRPSLTGAREVLEGGLGESVSGRGSLVDTMPSGVGEEAGRAAIGARRLTTPIEVAAYLQVPVRTLYTWRYERKFRSPIVGPKVNTAAWAAECGRVA